MRVGRNDPCPCGSGKKYKKCCWRKDQEAATARNQREQAERAAALAPRPPAPAPLAPPSPPEVPPNPHVQALDAVWEEFEAQDYEGRIALFTRTLDDRDVLDEQLAFDMLDQIYLQAGKHNQRERFDGLVALLRERRPVLYEPSAPYYLSWLIANALASSRQEALPALTQEMAATAARDPDIFHLVLDELEYHGQLDCLVAMMRTAWPDIKASKDILPWAVDEYADQGARYEIFAYLGTAAAPDVHDPVLLERLRFFVEDPDLDYVARSLDALTGKNTRVWVLSDFEMRPPRQGARGGRERDQTSSDPGRQNVADLTMEFLGYVHRKEGVPYTRGEQARVNLVEYLGERHAGELEPHDDRLALRQRRQSKPRPRKPAHPLCPDRGTLDRYLARLVQFLSGRHYQAASLFELLPAWLRFLQLRQLVTPEERQRTLQDLCRLHTDLLPLYKAHEGSDPTLARMFEAWEKEAEKEPVP